MESEEEYKNILQKHMKWAKTCTTNSAVRNCSSRNADIIPAQKTFEFINGIKNEKGMCFKEKVDMLAKFYNKEIILECSSECMGSTFFANNLSNLKKLVKEIES